MLLSRHKRISRERAAEEKPQPRRVSNDEFFNAPLTEHGLANPNRHRIKRIRITA